MKKKALSLVSYLLCAVMLLTSLAIPVAATESAAAKSLNDYLIVHYDFEETEAKTALQDKATAGTYADDLISAGGVLITDGVATMVNDSGALSTAYTYDANATTNVKYISSSTDLSQVYQSAEGGTWFIRFKVGATTAIGSTDNYTPLLAMRAFGSDVSRPLMIAVSQNAATSVYPTPNSLQTRIGNDYAGSQFLSATTTYKQHEWYNVAVVFEGLTAAGKMRFTSYLIDEEGAATSFGTYEISAQTVAGLPLSLFNELNGQNGWQTGNRFVGASIDDVRYYTKALSTDELGGIVEGLVSKDLDKNINKKLLVHYDFEGEGEVAFQDKAPTVEEGGISAVNDALVNQVGTFEVENGVVMATKDSAGLATAWNTDGAATCPNYSTSSDLAKIYADAKIGTTWFVRFAAPASTTDAREVGLINTRLFDDNATNNHRLMYTDFNSNNTLTVKPGGGSATVITYETDEWTNLVITYDGVLNNTSYFSVYLVKDGVATHIGTHNYAALMGNTNPTLPLSLFSEFQSVNGWTRYTLTGMKMDDVRIYNDKLTSAEMVALAAGFEIPDVLSKGVQIADDGTSIRAVAQMKGLNYTGAGFIVSMIADNGSVAEETVPVSYAYTTINAGTGVEVAADGCYLFVLRINLVGELATNAVWTITPYATAADGTVSYGQTYTYNESTQAVAWVA